MPFFFGGHQIVVNTDPSGVVHAQSGTRAFLSDGSRSWDNVDGGTEWSEVGVQIFPTLVGIGHAPDNAALTIASSTYRNMIRLWGNPAAGPLPCPLDLKYYSSIFDGVINPLWIQEFNSGLVSDYPYYSKNIEFRYVSNAPPLGFIEEHSNYVSIDRSVSYRPWMHHINLNDHTAHTIYQGLGTFKLFNLDQSHSLSYDAGLDTLVVTGSVGCSSLNVGVIDSTNGQVKFFRSSAVGVQDMIQLTAYKSDPVGSGLGITWYGSIADGANVWPAGGIYSVFDSTALTSARTTIVSRKLDQTTTDTLSVINGKVGVGTIAPDSTFTLVAAAMIDGLRVGGIHIKSPNTPGISLEATDGDGNKRNFAITCNQADNGILTVWGSSTQGGIPTTALMHLDVINNCVIFPSLAGVGSRYMKADANGKISAP